MLDGAIRGCTLPWNDTLILFRFFWVRDRAPPTSKFSGAPCTDSCYSKSREECSVTYMRILYLKGNKKWTATRCRREKGAMNVSCAVHEETRVAALQWLWDCTRAGIQQILLSPYLPASCAFLMHVILCAPFLALDALARVCQRVRSWRIDAGSGPPPPLWRWCECFWRVLYRYLTTVIPVTALFQAVRAPTFPEQAPTCWQLFVEVFASFLLFDTFFFIWHLSMHRWAAQTGHHLESSVGSWCCTVTLD